MQEYVDGLFPKLEPHPARALYALWKRVMEIQGRRQIPWGEQGLGISFEDAADEVIIFGPQWNGAGTMDRFTLASDGRFKMNHYWGWGQRRAIARNIPFLGFGHTHGSYCWAVEFEDMTRSRWGGLNLEDWQSPYSYIPESMMGVRHWSIPSRWMELRQFGEEWRIIPSPKQDRHTQSGDEGTKVYEDAQKAWDRFEPIRTKRYERLEYFYRRAQGMDMPEHLIPKRERKREPTLQVGNAKFTGHDATWRLAALLAVDEPAKTTPLKRPKEAQHGNHLAAPNHV